ncbi:MAG: LysM peptidoglycan-binding domain-containing protein, partial [Bacilli bacterium]|nr:LysM peptidoglycan-binding domain-containing protein [Bacilli bacterium]
LSSIASKFGTTPDVIKNINNIYFDSDVREGIDLIVPKNKEQYFNYYTIEAGDSLYKIAQKYNINPTLLANLNGLDMDDYIYPNQDIMIPKSGYSYYITAEGDTLDTVADVFNISKRSLLDQNETIYVLKDQVLVAKRK